MPSLDPAVLKRIATATAELSVAEEQLKTVLEAIETTARADKKIIGSALQEAFSTVVAARSVLAAVLEEP